MNELDLLLSTLFNVGDHAELRGPRFWGLTQSLDVATLIIDRDNLIELAGHAGELVAGYLGRTPVIMLAGRMHYYEHGDPNAMRKPIEVLMGLGVKSLILTNAAGCGSALHEYPLILRGTVDEARAKEFGRRVMDVSVFLTKIGLREKPRGLGAMAGAGAKATLKVARPVSAPLAGAEPAAKKAAWGQAAPPCRPLQLAGCAVRNGISARFRRNLDKPL